MNDEYPNFQQIAAIAERLGAHDFQCWFYGDSIGFEGLIAAAKLLNTPQWMDFSKVFLELGPPEWNPFSPMTTLPQATSCAKSLSTPKIPFYKQPF